MKLHALLELGLALFVISWCWRWRGSWSAREWETDPMTRLERRLLTDRLVKYVATTLAALAIVLLAWILWTVFYRGLGALSLSVFHHAVTESPGVRRTANAIVARSSRWWSDR